MTVTVLGTVTVGWVGDVLSFNVPSAVTSAPSLWVDDHLVAAQRVEADLLNREWYLEFATIARVAIVVTDDLAVEGVPASWLEDWLTARFTRHRGQATVTATPTSASPRWFRSSWVGGVCWVAVRALVVLTSRPSAPVTG